MKVRVQILLGIAATLCGPMVYAQTTPEAATTKSVNSNSPVAFVYVSSAPGGVDTGSKNVVNAYAAAANGKLTAVAGSPFKDDIGSMAVNGKYLFGATRSGKWIAAFRIGANGALQWSTSTNALSHNPSGCGGNSPLLLDHTGTSLYAQAASGTDGEGCQNFYFQAFQVVPASGYVSYLGGTTAFFFDYGQLTFRADNKYAYQATCSDYRGFYASSLLGFQRHSNGLLTNTTGEAPIPAAPSGDFYCSDQVAGDPANHLAVALQLINTDTELPDGPTRLATYTSAASGELTTLSTSQNMPETAILYPRDLKMSPSGKLVAVAGSTADGSGGLQIFHYNGASPVTAFTGVLTNVPIDAMYWDNSNHLYAISQSGSKLFVFNATSTAVSQAPGSPYTIANPLAVIAQPK